MEPVEFGDYKESWTRFLNHSILGVVMLSIGVGFSIAVTANILKKPESHDLMGAGIVLLIFSVGAIRSALKVRRAALRLLSESAFNPAGVQSHGFVKADS